MKCARYNLKRMDSLKLPSMSPLPSGIRDNRHRGSVAADFLQQYVKANSKLSFVSAYFTIYAFEKLQSELESCGELRFLFGEPSFLQGLDPEKTDKRAFSLTHESLSLANQLKQKAVARDCAAFFRRDDVQIRSVKHPDFLHGKLYHIENGGSSEAILGSSNFTVRGLGMAAQTSNLELNLIVDSRRDLDDLRKWFDEVWDDGKNVVDVKDEVLGYLDKLYAENSPRELYYKTLIHVLESGLVGQSDSELFGDVRGFVQSQIWNTLYRFQQDGVRAAVNKIQRHNGCIIADSVGLGKTFEALAVIKYFELKGQRVLVLCPKRLRENWTIYTANSHLNPLAGDRFGYTVLSHTDLGRDSGTVGIEDLASFNWGQFGLVVIDESHNFRNNARGRKRADGTHAPSRYEALMDAVIKQGARTQVLLLSATPVNNDLKDLRNQIYLMSGDEDDAFTQSLGLHSVKDTLANAQRAFNKWADDPKTRHNSAALYQSLSGNFFTLLDGLTIARSRGHIERHYADTLAEIGRFPTRARPIAVFPHIDNQKLFLSFDRLDEEISRYQLALFKPSTYVRDEFSAQYANQAGSANFSQEKREKYLIGMMKVNFLKRLESSIASFAISMQRTIDKISALETTIADYQKRAADDLTLFAADDSGDDEAPEGGDDPLEELTVGKGLQYQLRHMDLTRWLRDLRADKQQLHSLLLHARDVTPERDDKLDKLKILLQARMTAPPTSENHRGARKVLIFTAFSDTADYLFEQLQPWATKLGFHIAKVTGGAGGTATTLGKADFNEILTNFSPRSKKRAGSATVGSAHEFATRPPSGGGCPLGGSTFVDTGSNRVGEGRHFPMQSGLAANSFASNPAAEIDLLIATDCISEGQNLQDCGYLVNYDIHWNPVRLIQRFGRIDRIGSLFGEIQMVNFWPIEDLNRYINLKSRVESRMALADLSATAGDNPLAPPAENVEQELKYRDEQLLKLKDQVLDLEELEDVSLGDFSLEDFRLELLDFLDQDAKRLRELPLGMVAVVAATEKHPPGAVFCLRAVNPDPNLKPSNLNPTAPYYLLYIAREKSSDAELERAVAPLPESDAPAPTSQPVVRLGFAQARGVLSMLRELCDDKVAPDAALCEAFALATQSGQNMTLVNDLVACAVGACREELQQKSLSSLTQRGAQLMSGGAKKQTAEFELVTWFVIA